MSDRWSLSENVALFAWLDFCIANKINCLNTIQKHMEKETGISWSKHSARASLRFLEWKYRNLNEKRGLKPDEQKGSLYIVQTGSKCLQYPPKDMMRLIKKALINYKNKYSSEAIQELLEPKFVKSDQGQSPANIPTRESSPAGKRDSLEEIEEVSRKRQCLKKVRENFKLAPIHGSQLLDVELSLASIEPVQPENPAQASRTRSSRTNFTSGKVAHRPSGKQPTRAATPTSNEDLELSFSPRSLLVDRPSVESPAKNQHNQVGEGILEDMQEHHKEILQIKEAEIRIIREQWDSDLRTFYGKVERLERSEMVLTAKNSALEAAASDIKGGGSNPLEQMIAQKNVEIWKLTQQLRRQLKVTQLGETEAKYLPPQTIHTAMNEIRFVLEDIIRSNALCVPLGPNEWFDGDLEYLVNSAFDTPRGSTEGKLQLKRLDVKLGPSAVFSILAITALRDWVFLTDFPHVDLGSMSLIESYRNIAFDKGGWEELRCFDFGAFKEYMKQPYFKDVLNRTAKQLACRLLRTLSFLFGESLERVGHDCSFHTWGEDFDSWNERRYHYEKLFQTALELKSGSVITDDTYTFEFSSKQEYISKPFNKLSGPEESWLCLSICAYGSKSLVFPRGKEGALVQTRNFLASVIVDWPCDYRKDIYLDVDRSYQTRNLSQLSRDRMNLSARHNTSTPHPMSHAADSESFNIAEIDHSAIFKAPTHTGNVPGLPKQPIHRVPVRSSECKLVDDALIVFERAKSPLSGATQPQNFSSREAQIRRLLAVMEGYDTPENICQSSNELEEDLTAVSETSVNRFSLQANKILSSSFNNDHETSSTNSNQCDETEDGEADDNDADDDESFDVDRNETIGGRIIEKTADDESTKVDSESTEVDNESVGGRMYGDIEDEDNEILETERDERIETAIDGNKEVDESEGVENDETIDLEDDERFPATDSIEVDDHDELLRAHQDDNDDDDCHSLHDGTESRNQKRGFGQTMVIPSVCAPDERIEVSSTLYSSTTLGSTSNLTVPFISKFLTMYIYKWTLITITITLQISTSNTPSLKVANANVKLHSLITEAPATAALALLSTTSILRGATAPINYHRSIPMLAHTTDCNTGT
ncbi:hypothetical protein SBOR_4756 [Sclerotinia borealis F-4128]|uniref:Uncharacterized protein n=1 Tax=Sclerotinia borealis (strain F-4128) TaxID=1432307 RepID=W9CK45_SCLBF|nr:hypothetical protein SBOR_4756 [Sclerotinia borealis F-4128]